MWTLCQRLYVPIPVEYDHLHLIIAQGTFLTVTTLFTLFAVLYWSQETDAPPAEALALVIITYSWVFMSRLQKCVQFRFADYLNNFSLQLLLIPLFDFPEMAPGTWQRRECEKRARILSDKCYDGSNWIKHLNLNTSPGGLEALSLARDCEIEAATNEKWLHASLAVR